jgi:diguanylate cyclase (GGDEF)-like protein
MKNIAHEGRPEREPPAETAARESVHASRFRLSLTGWLAFGLGGIVVVFLAGNLLVQRSTRLATENVTRVQQELEPLARRARALSDAISNYERAVLSYLKPGAPAEHSVVDAAQARMQAAITEHIRYTSTDADLAAVRSLADAVTRHETNGSELVQRFDRRSALISTFWSLMDGLRKRIDGAGADGLTVGENVFARRSLAELANALEAARSSFTVQLTQPSVRNASEAARNELAFRKKLKEYSEEFKRSPGLAWYELVQDDFERAARLNRSVAQLDAELEAGRREFAGSGAELIEQVRVSLEEPALRALAESATEARATTQDAENMIAAVSLAVVCVILLVTAATLYGITRPVRRLTEATRDLAGGELTTRVPRGGIRELDELAIAFNHMATELNSAEQAVRSHQAQLEERVAQRTRQLRLLAHHDALTSLPNRRHLFAYLHSALRRAAREQQRITVLFVDLDNFKMINDSLGHEFGDRVLRLISERLKEVVGDRGFVARLGGDEFTLIMPGESSMEEVETRATRMVAEFQRPISIELRELLIGMSVGAAVYPDHATDGAALLRAADAALFRAKELGRNRACVYSPEMLIANSNRFQTEQALRRAIEVDDLVLHFQPQVSLASHEATAVEALLRWRQGNGRIVPAADFLQVAEQSGLIIELSAWVMQRAAHAVALWRRAGWPQARVALNVCSQQFMSGEFVNSIERLLRENDVPPGCIELELTETMLQTGAVTIDTLRALHDLGVGIALDDFGTGYSSLTSLEKLPLNRVKLDRSLIDSVDSNARSAAIARSIITLCRTLGLHVTAEGIERPAQLDFLAECGDVCVQGYYVERPAPASEVLGLVAAMPARMKMLLGTDGREHEEVDISASGVVRLRPRRR